MRETERGPHLPLTGRQRFPLVQAKRVCGGSEHGIGESIGVEKRVTYSERQVLEPGARAVPLRRIRISPPNYIWLIVSVIVLFSCRREGLMKLVVRLVVVVVAKSANRVKSVCAPQDLEE